MTRARRMPSLHLPRIRRRPGRQRRIAAPAAPRRADTGAARRSRPPPPCLETRGPLGREFYIGLPRMVEVDQSLRREISHDTAGGLILVRDHETAAVITALADEYEALNDPGQRSLLTCLWGLFPDLREREREPPRVFAWLGRQAVEARHWSARIVRNRHLRAVA